MNHIGISAGFHDAALCVIDNNGHIVYATHSERWSKIKHDSQLHHQAISDCLEYYDPLKPTRVHYYERPLYKWARQLWCGQRPRLSQLSAQRIIGKEHLLRLGSTHVHTHGHHLSHAAAGFQTSPHERATVVIIDAIGEWDTATIWAAHYDSQGRARYKKLWSLRYPHSIGLFYSALTQRAGLKPLDEEYILMGAAALGSSAYTSALHSDTIESVVDVKLVNNLHCGVDSTLLGDAHLHDIAHSTQQIAEQLINSIMYRAKSFDYSENLVYGGGVALNCVANRNLGHYFRNIWIMPNPGDAGSALGAAALGWGKRIQWRDAYLGHDICRPYPVQDLLQALTANKIAGVASGRSEWGPRALGNRSLLADPRGTDIKQRVNDIKQRQQYRPFAPAILAEHVNAYFQMPPAWSNSNYMQVVAQCKCGDEYPAIIHADGTSRVQTVPQDGSGFRRLLEAWYQKTGCPMLLNTSLNIRGQPMVNDLDDAREWSKHYNIPVVV